MIRLEVAAETVRRVMKANEGHPVPWEGVPCSVHIAHAFEHLTGVLAHEDIDHALCRLAMVKAINESEVESSHEAQATAHS